MRLSVFCAIVVGCALMHCAALAAETPRQKKEQATRAVVEKSGRTSKNEDLGDGMARMLPKGLSCGLSLLW